MLDPFGPEQPVNEGLLAAARSPSDNPLIAVLILQPFKLVEVLDLGFNPLEQFGGIADVERAVVGRMHPVIF